MATLFLMFILATLPFSNSEYKPPGPAYPCPKENLQLLYPCVCEKGTDAGIYVKCENSGLAVLSVGLGNIAGLGLPIERLEIKQCPIENLFGPLLHRSTVRVLRFADVPIRTIDENAFFGVNRTLQELYMKNTEIDNFPKDAFKILGNLSILSIDGHRITKLSKDIFAGSEAAGRLEKLHLTNGLINDIPTEAFQNLKKLKTLDLHGNRLATLKRNQFKGLRDTEVLDISHNNITKLDGQHIGDLTKLGWCNVSNNQIGEIARGMFARNTVLKVLHLNGNKIKKIDTNSFRGMRFLRRLFLQDNMISDVGRGAFAAVTRIGTVDLARNNITKVDYQMFQQVKYAEVINLAENQIKIIESQAFTDLYLATVNISHNDLSTIEKGAFQNCQNLTMLDLSYNKIVNISRGAFDENSYAGEFTVAYNNIVDFAQIPVQNMSGIRVLNASYNQITSIPKMAFPKLYELHTVDVSHNNLTEIYNAVFQNLFSLRYLNLSYNSMEIIKPATFGSIPTVLHLDLSHNKLRDPSRGGLAKLASCRTIDVSYNQLDRIFQIPISLSELNFAHNNLTEIKPNAWPTMNALLRLNLSSNMLSDNLSTDSFAGLLTLQNLDLSDNGVTTPPWQALNTLTSLQYLYLQDNNITALSKAAFGNLPTIFQLDLSNNQLVDIAQESFKGLQQLLDLSLRNNMLEKVRIEAFKGLVALRKLDLSHNYLERIDNKTHGLLDDCLSLEAVNLSRNRFGFLTKKMFPASPWIPYRLFEVDLSYNEIPVLTLDLTIGTKKLKKLVLKGNIINDIRNNVLGNLTSLEVLDLSDNQLKDLVSRTSDLQFNLPENLTELYLQNNTLQEIPIKQIVNATRLRLLDVRDNLLDGFHPALVRKMRDQGMKVYFEGNNLKCDCFTRPLKHLLNRQTIDTNVTCSEPLSMAGQSLHTIDEERLLCAKNIGLEEKIKELRGEEFDFELEPDLSFRDVQYSQSSIYAHWFVRTPEDVADFFLFIIDDKGKVVYSNEVPYNMRSVTITIDDDLQTSLQNGGKFDICVQAKKSNGFARKRYASQCQNAPSNFESWPKKLTVDKRRLTKKKTYAFFGGKNNVLRKLDLSHNYLERIDNKTHGLLDDCLSLEAVNLSRNRFGFLTKKMFPASPWIPYRLFEVDLSYNEIPVLTLDLTIGTKKLKKLVLKGNIINDIRNNVLGNLTSLEVLDLSDNQLKDLVSRTSDLQFNLPENLTELYLQNNTLQEIPIKQIVNATRLRLLDVRDNLLDGFHPALVRKMRDQGMKVYFEGNNLKCDCFTRPLKHLLNRQTIDTNVTCSEPLSMAGQSLHTIDEERLLCAKNIGLEEKIKELRGEEFDFELEPDLSFRDVQYSQSSIYAHWFVRTPEDVADFFLFIIDDKGKVVYSNEVPYNMRSVTITIDNDLQTSLQNGGKFDICVQAKKSNGFARKRYASQCQNVPSNFESWPKKLTVDKRRLTKKKTYSFFGGKNNVLRLVSDSILITLCIFLGVCFRKLADFEI